jgi:hypothetical protein
MKIAKLEMKLVLALKLLGYNYELVNDSDKYPDILPEPDRNDIILVSYSLFRLDSTTRGDTNPYLCQTALGC